MQSATPALVLVSITFVLLVAALFPALWRFRRVYKQVAVRVDSYAHMSASASGEEKPGRKLSLQFTNPMLNDGLRRMPRFGSRALRKLGAIGADGHTFTSSDVAAKKLALVRRSSFKLRDAGIGESEWRRVKEQEETEQFFALKEQEMLRM